MEAVIVGEQYHITFPWSQASVDFCRRLQRARYNPRERRWEVARITPNALDLQQAGLLTDAELLDGAPVVAPTTAASWSVNAPLYPHQEHWRSICERMPKALLCADMGTGKTLMAMSWMHVHGVRPEDTIVVCPVSLLYHWQKELEQYAGIRGIVVIGTPAQRQRALQETGIHLVNYEYCALAGGTMRPELVALRKTGLICDEVHKIKGATTQRSKALHKFSAGMTHVLGLTGTPISQGAQDYYSQMKLLHPTLLGASYTAFKTRYCVQQQVWGAPVGVRKITGYQRLDELSRLIAPYTHTIRKDDCLTLPPKRYSVRYVELTPEQSRVYRQLKTDMAAWLEEGRREETTEPVTAANILTRLMRLSQVTQGFCPQSDTNPTLHLFAPNPKIQALADFLDELGPQPLVVVCRFTQDLKLVQQFLTEQKIAHATINGDTPVPFRQELVDRFQTGKFPILLGETRTLGVGFTLTRAQHMLFYSNTYSLVDRVQAEDRLHRIGATGESCHYIDLVARGTVDEDVLTALRSKQDVASALMQLRLDSR